MARERDEARLAAAAATQRTQQERDTRAEVEGENEGLRMRLQMMEKEMAILAGEADQVRRCGGQMLYIAVYHCVPVVWRSQFLL